MSICIGTTNTTLERRAERDTGKKDINTETSGNYHDAIDAPVINKTSGDITESIYNSRGTEEWNSLHTTISFLTTSVEFYVEKIEGKSQCTELNEKQ